MLTVEDFLEAGYKRFEQTYNSADYGLQKSIREIVSMGQSNGIFGGMF